MRVYELGFHIDSELPVEEAKKTYQGMHTAIASVGTIVAEGEPQKIPLAYTISRGETAGRRDFNTSFFAWIAYETDGAGHEKVLETARAESRIFRFLDLRTTKEGAQHSAEVHELMSKIEPAEGAEGEAADAELEAALKEVGV
jgi:ribosomal protein S6